MLVAVSATAFVLLSNAGGDAFTSLRDNPQISAATIDALRETYGLDKPVIMRYLYWLASFATGDLGESIHFRVPVVTLVMTRLYHTVLLGTAALVIAWTVSLSLSFFAALKKSRGLDQAIEIVILVAASTPRIALALFTLALFVALSQTAFALGSGSTLSFLVSAFVLSVPLIAVFLAQADLGLRSALNEDFVKLARAKGLSESVVLLRHASRSALNPLLTLFGLSLGGIIGGAVIVETILGWQGIGSLTVTAVRVRDVPLVMGIVVISTLAVWLGNLVAELLQFANDKRIRDDALA